MLGDQIFSQSDVLRMGWTKKLIDDFLPNPILQPNPMYKRAAPMKTWQRVDVLQIMERDDFKAAFEKATKRKESARKAVLTKEVETQKAAEAFAKTIDIKIIPDDLLIESAKRNAFEVRNRRSRFFKEILDIDEVISYVDYNDPDEATLKRWVVNYIRHCLTKYDHELCIMQTRLEGKVGVQNTYSCFKDMLLSRIAEAYPKYQDECVRQMSLNAEAS